MLKLLQKLPASKIAASTAALGTVLAAALQVWFGFHAGALWRDEVTSVEIATMRTLSELWANLAFESFPALFVVLLRIMAGGPASVSDPQLRVFGVLIGLLILGALWLNARWLRFRWPLISLALLGFNPMVIRYGESIRAYGLGIVLMLVSLGAMWRFAESPTRRRAIIAAIAAVLSVQCLYYNAVLLFAVCLGACAVTLRRRDFRSALVVLGIGALAAVSLIPYVPTIQRVSAWSFIWKVPFTASAVWRKLSETLGASNGFSVWIWLVLFAMALLLGVAALLRGREYGSDRVLFALVTLIAGTLAYAGFLKVLNYLTQPWYYIAFLAFAATCMETLLAVLGTTRALLARATFALLFIALSGYPTFAALRARQTNIDLVAARLETLSTRGDLIVLNPFPYGISFQRYYHGVATYRAVPPLADLRSHRADLLKEQMMSAAPMEPLLEELEETLRTGHTVWLIGGLDFLAPGASPLVVPPGFDSPAGWVGGNFYKAWSEQAGSLLQKHAQQFERIQVPLAQPVVHYENVALSAFRGWRQEETTLQQ